MNPEIQEIKSQLQALLARISNLDSSSTFPRTTENAIRQRIADVKSTIGTVAKTSTGAFPFDLPNTTGTLPIVVNGKTYYVLINNPL